MIADFSFAFFFQSVNEGIVDLDLSWNCLRKQGAAAIVGCLRVINCLSYKQINLRPILRIF